MTQRQVRAVLMAALRRHALPRLHGRAVWTVDVQGQDEAVSHAPGVITDIALLEGHESGVLLTLAIDGYGPTDVLLEELE